MRKGLIVFTAFMMMLCHGAFAEGAFAENHGDNISELINSMQETKPEFAMVNALRAADCIQCGDLLQERIDDLQKTGFLFEINMVCFPWEDDEYRLLYDLQFGESVVLRLISVSVTEEWTDLLGKLIAGENVDHYFYEDDYPVEHAQLMVTAQFMYNGLEGAVSEDVTLF